MRKDLSHNYKIKSTKGCLAFKSFFINNSVNDIEKLNKVLLIIDYWFLKLENFYNNENIDGLLYIDKKLEINKDVNLSDAINSFYNRKYIPTISFSNNILINAIVKIYFKIFINHKEIIISGGEGKYSKIHDLLSNFWIRIMTF